MSTGNQNSTKTLTEIKVPDFYSIIIHDDDTTELEFVVDVLTNVFGLHEEGAIEIAYKAIEENHAYVGSFTHERANALVSIALEEANKTGNTEFKMSIEKD